MRRQKERAAETGDEVETIGSAGLFGRLKQGLSRTRRGLVRGMARLTRGGALDEQSLDELEELLIQADIGVGTALELVDEVRSEAEQGNLEADGLRPFLRDRIHAILEGAAGELAPIDEERSPTVYLVIGVNGAGKTTTIGKLALRRRQEGKRVLLAAGDTFRPAAIDQLAVWADRTGVDLIRHREGSDPGAVVYDAVRAAKSRRADLVLVDTAGRLHNKVNLMKELSKVARVVERELGRPADEVLLVVDATMGQNALSQAERFAESVPVSGIALTKLDGTAKGGIVVAIAKELGVPVKLVGVGESADDLRPFQPGPFVDALFADEGDEAAGSEA